VTLLYCFNHLGDADSEVASEAFMEFAKATDGKSRTSARRSSREGARPPAGSKTPGERLGMYA